MAWYCLRATFRVRRRNYAALAVIVGLVGGLALASVAGARRTQSSYPELLAHSNASQVEAFTGVINPLLGFTTGYNAHLVDEISRLPHVGRVGSQVGLDVLPLGANGVPIELKAFPAAAGNGVGSVNGEGFTQDRLSVVSGRLADPGRPGEIDLSQPVAQLIGWHVGQRIRMGVYTNDQTNLPAFGGAKVRPDRVEVVTVVGIVVEPHQVVEDDVDDSQSLAFFTPAFTAPLVSCCVNYAASAVQVSGGSGAVAAVTAAVGRLLPKLAPAPIVASLDEAKAERAIKPESIALGVFGGIVALAALLIVIQLIGRLLRLCRAEAEGLRAIGADPLVASGHVLLGTAGAAGRGIAPGRRGGGRVVAVRPSRAGQTGGPEPGRLVRLDRPRRRRLRRAGGDPGPRRGRPHRAVGAASAPPACVRSGHELDREPRRGRRSTGSGRDRHPFRPRARVGPTPSPSARPSWARLWRPWSS